MNYKEMFTSAVLAMPRFMELAKAVIWQINELQYVISSMKEEFSLEEAVGVQLDQIGKGLSVSRPLNLSDDDYRELILKKLRLWRWNGTNEEVPGVLEDIDPEGSETDNDNLTVTIASSGSLPVPAVELYPLAAGVTVSGS